MGSDNVLRESPVCHPSTQQQSGLFTPQQHGNSAMHQIRSHKECAYVRQAVLRGEAAALRLEQGGEGVQKEGAEKMRVRAQPNEGVMLVTAEFITMRRGM